MLLSLRTPLRRRPKAAALVVLLLVLAAGVGLYVYVLHQWHAAQAAVKDGRPADAKRGLDVALRVWPDNVEVHLLAARAARLSGDFESAESHLNRCIKLAHGPTDAIRLEFLLMRAQTGEVDEVAPALFDAIDHKHAESALIFETIARAYMQELRYGPAYQCLTHWIDVDPNAVRAYHWRGWVAERLNNAKAATADYNRALELDPDLTQVRLRVAEMLLEDKLPAEAAVHLDRLRKQFPNRSDVAARLGQCRYLQGRSAEARELLESAAKEMPDDASRLLYLAKLDIADGRGAEAEANLRRALKADPGDTELEQELVPALRLQGRDDEAAEAQRRYDEHKVVLERANKLLKEEAEQQGTDPDRAYTIAVELLKIGHDRLGLYWLDKALQRDPNHQPTHRALADYFERKGEPDKAAAHRRRLH
jgi:Tfp pilus assembly protein PilF